MSSAAPCTKMVNSESPTYRVSSVWDTYETETHHARTRASERERERERYNKPSPVATWYDCCPNTWSNDLFQGKAVRDMQRGPDHPEGKHISRWCLDFSARAGLNASLVTYHWEVSSEAKISLRRSRYSGPHLAPRTASRQLRSNAEAGLSQAARLARPGVVPLGRPELKLIILIITRVIITI